MVCPRPDPKTVPFASGALFLPAPSTDPSGLLSGELIDGLFAFKTSPGLSPFPDGSPGSLGVEGLGLGLGGFPPPFPPPLPGFTGGTSFFLFIEMSFI